MVLVSDPPELAKQIVCMPSTWVWNKTWPSFSRSASFLNEYHDPIKQVVWDEFLAGKVISFQCVLTCCRTMQCARWHAAFAGRSVCKEYLMDLHESPEEFAMRIFKHESNGYILNSVGKIPFSKLNQIGNWFAVLQTTSQSDLWPSDLRRSIQSRPLQSVSKSPQLRFWY